MTNPRFRDGQVYLGWQQVLLHPDPGPAPRRPVPPEAEQLDPGWLAAQRRETAMLSRPAELAILLCLAGAAAVVVLRWEGMLDAALTWLGIAVCVACAAMATREIWRGRRGLRAAVAAETQRVARARAAQERGLFASQDDHARRFRDWQSREQAFARQPRWYPVAVPGEVDRIDVVGGTQAGWSALVTTLAAPLLATGGEVTVIDLSEGAVARDLVALGQRTGLRPLVWVLPGDLPRLDLGVGLPVPALADVLATSASSDAAANGGPDQVRDQAIIERVLGVLGESPAIAEVAAGLRALAQVGDPRVDIGAGLLTPAQLDTITGLFGRGAADRVVIERALALEARLRHLERLGAGMTPLPHSRLRVVATDRAGGVSANAVVGAYVTVALTHLLARIPAGQPWRHTLCLAGAERLRGEMIDRLCDACESARSGLVLAYRSVPAHVRERLGRGNAALAVMRVGNAEDARVTSEQIGTEHRFVLSQFTDTVGSSVTGTGTDSYTSTVGTADSVSGSESVSRTSGHSRGRGHSSADVAPFGQRTGSGSREASRSRATSDSHSLTEGITAGTSWGVSTATAIGVNESLARTAQRSREFLVEAHELQRLPPSAVIVSYASRQGRQVVLADANPAILALPTATLLTPEEARREEEAAPAGQAGPLGEAAPLAEAGPLGEAGPAGQAGPLGEAGPEQALTPDAADRAAAPGPRPVPERRAGPGQAARPAWPVSWRAKQDRLPPNLGAPPEPLDWRKPRR